MYDLGAGQRWEGLGAQPERGMGRGRRLRKEKQLELISWGLAKKEAQALGNLLVSCLLLHNPLPASSAACVTQDLAHYWRLPIEGAPAVRQIWRPPLGEETCFQAARRSLPKRRDILPSVNTANQKIKQIPGWAGLQSARQCGEQTCGYLGMGGQ